MVSLTGMKLFGRYNVGVAWDWIWQGQAILVGIEWWSLRGRWLEDGWEKEVTLWFGIGSLTILLYKEGQI